jgi:asparagine synthase (glutamine-hydrolysing)
MADSIRHRGPDDEGCYLDGPIGLASRRLSIIDLDHGRQPIANEDETVWIVFNGEIYNYPELRADLLERGHTFRTHTDTEVIVHLWEEYGRAAVARLRGMFAFALWDTRTRELLLARDPLGQKPLYYAEVTEQGGPALLFGSEIKALLVDPALRPQLNSRALHHYISLRYIPAADTLFAGINKLPAAHTLLFRDGQIDIQPYWELTYEPKWQGSEAELVRRLRDLLLETVEAHLLSDVPLGAFLSGGIDSSLIAAMMATLAPDPISTFSIGVPEKDFSELPYARLVAERYGTRHYEAIVSPNLVADLPRMIWHMDEPVDPFAFGVFAVAQLASQHVKVVLGGDGGDEIFAGYDRYFGNQIIDYYLLVPTALRRHVIGPMVARLPDNFSYNNRVQKLRWLVAMSETGADERYARSASHLRFSHAQKEALYTPALWGELGGLNSLDELLRYFNAANAREMVDKMLFTDVKTRLADHLLMIGDRMTMAHSVEGRSPYVDKRVVEFAARLPSNLKLRGRKLKHIQREVARPYLPETLVTRPKQGFGFPLAYWFKGPLRPLMQELIASSRLAEAGLFRGAAMADLLDEHAAGRVDHNYRLWLLLNIELWLRMFMDGMSQDDLNGYLQERVGAAQALT